MEYASTRLSPRWGSGVLSCRVPGVYTPGYSLSSLWDWEAAYAENLTHACADVRLLLVLTYTPACAAAHPSLFSSIAILAPLLAPRIFGVWSHSWNSDPPLRRPFRHPRRQATAVPTTGLHSRLCSLGLLACRGRNYGHTKAQVVALEVRRVPVAVRRATNGRSVAPATAPAHPVGAILGTHRIDL